MVKINGMPFEPVPGCRYKTDPVRVSHLISTGEWDERSAYRQLILDDLWFVVYFVLKIPVANHPFWVDACREVESGPQDYTLDVWAREHGKSSIITIAETIQYALRHPNNTTGIFSYVRPVSKKFLFTIKDTFENEKILSSCFPDVVWANPRQEAPIWSLDDGLILKRSTSRKEPNVSAWGLVEGMPTGLHFERRVYDDISTEDIAESVDMMEKVKNKFDSSQNIGTDGGHHRVIGTYYHHNDPLIYIRDKKSLEGEKKYLLRYKPATDDGTAMGKPVYLSQRRLDDLRITRSFNCQQLLDPSPIADQALTPEYLTPVERRLIPKNVYRFMLVDQAGDLGSAKSEKNADSWAVGVVAVEPFTDDIGQSRVFIEDLWISPANESEAIDQIVRMYLNAGMIMRICVEKVGISTTHLHIAAGLKARGRYILFDKGGNGVLLRPAGRNKRKMIESALSWPLNNGKIFYSTAVPTNYMERLKMEMRNFPVWHDDGLNMLAYLYDALQDFSFGLAEEQTETEKQRRYEQKPAKQSWMSM